MTRCLECQHWLPRKAPKGMAALGFAPCAKRSISMGHTFSAYTCCPFHEQTESTVIQARTEYLRRCKMLPGGEQVSAE